MQSPPFPRYLVPLRSILILSTHLRLGLPSGILPSGFPTKTLYTPLSSPIRATCQAHLILLHFITRAILGEQYRSLSSSLCSSLQSTVTSLPWVQILSSTPCSQKMFNYLSLYIFECLTTAFHYAETRGHKQYFCCDWRFVLCLLLYRVYCTGFTAQSSVGNYSHWRIKPNKICDTSCIYCRLSLNDVEYENWTPANVSLH